MEDEKGKKENKVIFEKPNNNNNSKNPENTNVVNDSKNKNIKYPFSGVAKNLIDKFLVLGYEQKTIDYTRNYCENIEGRDDVKTRFKFYEFEERPYVVNEICNDYTKDILDNDLILELIFPNMPEMYFLDKQYSSKKEIDEELLITPYSIIFSLNPQDNNNSKKSYNGLGYIFYSIQEQKIDDKLGNLYVPNAFVILSEFPYFYHFNEICRNVFFQMMKENDEIPIEILLFNIVKYAESPINKSINLTFAAPISIPIKNNNDLNKNLSPLFALSSREENKLPTMFFNQLSGYPFMDLNISFIFNLIPPDIIVQVFIFSFLEHDIIFYSQRPDILNMVMYIFSNFNYPLNDNIYYWHILSVSKGDFMNGTSTFVGKTSSTITGILSEYDPDLQTTNKIKEHFVLDIDNKAFFFLYQDDTDDVKDTITLYNYVKNVCAEFDEISNDGVKLESEIRKQNYFNDGVQLYEGIKNLMGELQRRAKKVTATNYNERNIKPSFLTLYEDESELECMNSNFRLQKTFFTFIAQMLQNFLSILIIEEASYTESRATSIVVNVKKEELNEEEEKKRKLAEKAGIIFRAKFKECSKYNSFVINFCSFHDTIDLYKIPYTFINEFIYYSHTSLRNNLNEVDVFKLIDQFYGRRKVLSFDDVKNQKDEKVKSDLAKEADIENYYLFNFCKFVDFYKDKLRSYINREQEDDRDIFSKVKSNSKAFKKYKRNGTFLSNKILNIYNNFSNNNEDKLRELFKLIKCENNGDNDNGNKINIIQEKSNKIIESSCAPLANSNEIDNNNKIEKDLNLFGSYEFMDITDIIERHFILERCFSSYGLIKFSLLNIIAITRGINDQNIKIKNIDVMNIICDFCEKTKSLARKYMNIYLNIFQTLKINNLDLDCDKCIEAITLYFTKTNMIPTEETFKTLNVVRDSQRNSDLKDISGDEAPLVKSDSNENNNKNKEEMNEYIKINGTFFEVQKEGGIFSGNKNTKKKFEEVVRTIEALFSGRYDSSKNSLKAIDFDYKEIEQLYNDNHLVDEEREKEKNNKSKGKHNFLPKTPLNLFDSTRKLLSEYLNNNLTISENRYNELLIDILSLLWYFKIPDIGGKWIEFYKEEEDRKPKEELSPKKEKNSKKAKESKPEKKNVEKKKIPSGFNEILKKIIAVLINLFEVINKMK